MIPLRRSAPLLLLALLVAACDSPSAPDQRSSPTLADEELIQAFVPRPAYYPSTEIQLGVYVSWRGRPYQGGVVSFSPDGRNGGGSCGNPAVSDATGWAWTTCTFGTRIGPQRFSATSTWKDNTGRHRFDFTVQQQPASIEKASAGAVSGVVHSIVPLSVKLTRGDDPADDVAVVWTWVTPGGGELLQTRPGPDGIATLHLRLWKDVRTVAVEVCVANTTRCETFMVTTTPDVPAVFVKWGWQHPIAKRNTTLPNHLFVRVLDRYGNPVPGQAVQWAATIGSGHTAGPISHTDAAGYASTSWTLGSLIGTQHVRATLTGTTLPAVGFDATATP